MKRKTILRWQAVTSTISATMVLILLGVLVIFVLTAKEIRDSVREDMTVTVVLADSVTPQKAHLLERRLAKRCYVHDITYISSEEALQDQVQTMGLDPREFIGSNPFSISMELRMNADYAQVDSLKWISRELKHDEGITDVIYQKELVDSLNTNLQRITIVLLVITVLLSVVSLSLIRNTIRMSIYSRRFIINTMKLVGARWNFIRAPFMLRSLLISIIAAAIADGVLYIGVDRLIANDNTIMQYLPEQNIMIMMLTVLVFSIIITMLCTFVSVTHFLRMRERDLYK